MKPTDFAKVLNSYLACYLPGQRNLSINTIKSYRDSFKLLLMFCNEKLGISPEYLTLSLVDKQLIYDYLQWIEDERKCGIQTRNQRLASIHAFFRYVQIESPESLLNCQKILNIPFKKTAKPSVCYLSTDALQLILAQPNINSFSGRRDIVLMTVLYDSAARVQELIDLVVRDIRIDKPSTITLTGKGDKTRYVPLMTKTTELLSRHLKEKQLNDISKLDYPVFFNSQKRKMTRAGISYILNKYYKMAKSKSKVRMPSKIHPHMFRSTKAMHLLQANINLIYIRDLLGHVSVTTTERYARANPEMRRAALEKAYVNIVEDDIPAWSKDSNLLDWLQELCK
jgi:integrase/recombinase XerD